MITRLYAEPDRAGQGEEIGSEGATHSYGKER